MTYEQAFEKIKEKLKDADTSKLTGDFAIQVDLTNKDCSGIFYIAYFNGVFEVQPYDYVDHYARIELLLGDFTKLVEGKLNVDKAIEDEKIHVTGDVTKIKELGTLVKKAPVKRTVKEKTAPVKETKAAVKEKAEVKKTSSVVKKPAEKKTSVKKNGPKKSTAAKKDAELK